MQAVILAAGMGKRLKELTRDNTKCMVKVNGVSLIERMLTQLDKHAMRRIVIVVGYKSRELIDFIGTLSVRTPIVYVHNPVYDKTNNIYSLALAKQYLCEDDTLLLESDLIFEDRVIDELLSDPRDTLALVDKYESWMDGTCVKLTENDDIEAFVPGKKFVFEEMGSYYKTVNIYKFSRHFSVTHYVPFLDAYSHALGNNEYYEQVLRVIAMLDDPKIKAKRLNGGAWYEIDDVQDLDIASSMFLPDSEKVKAMQSRYGGYWRYPKCLDFCYLVNPYFPPRKLMDEIKANFETLVTEYPSGMRVNSLLAAKNFGIDAENVVVGNGAAELIKSLMSVTAGGGVGNAGIVRPAFEEYSNRYPKDRQIIYTPDNADRSYTAADIAEFFEDKDIDSLVIVNPDNPSGNYIPFDDLTALIDRVAARGIKLVIDESFADFADEPDNTLIRRDILKKYDNLYVIKSISKSYGVPGLRLGVLASGDTETIARIKDDVSIWNINSLAEFYMQIAEKYADDYRRALAELKKERARFFAELGKFSDILRAIPSQANYIMAEVRGGLTSERLTRELLAKHSIMIKDLGTKEGLRGGNYVRIAVRDAADNDKLLAALSEIRSGYFGGRK